MEPDNYISFRTSSTVVSEGVYQFIRGALYGAIWGAVTPYYAAGTKGAALEASTGVFKAAPLLASPQSIPTNAIIFGTVLGVQRVSCKSMELLRRQQDVWNEAFGFFITYRYYTYFLASTEKRLMIHNRLVGGAVMAAMVYANLFA